MTQHGMWRLRWMELYSVSCNIWGRSSWCCDGQPIGIFRLLLLPTSPLSLAFCHGATCWGHANRALSIAVWFNTMAYRFTGLHESLSHTGTTSESRFYRRQNPTNRLRFYLRRMSLKPYQREELSGPNGISNSGSSPNQHQQKELLTDPPNGQGNLCTRHIGSRSQSSYGFWRLPLYASMNENILLPSQGEEGPLMQDMWEKLWKHWLSRSSYCHNMDMEFGRFSMDLFRTYIYTSSSMTPSPNIGTCLRLTGMNGLSVRYKGYLHRETHRNPSKRESRSPSKACTYCNEWYSTSSTPQLLELPETSSYRLLDHCDDTCRQQFHLQIYQNAIPSICNAHYSSIQSSRPLHWLKS